MEVPSDIQVHEIDVPNSKSLKVYVQGDLAAKQGKTVFLTCHDMGSNPKSWYPFILSQGMTEVRLRSIFLHVCIPGQEDNALTLPSDYVFPQLDLLAQDMIPILDHFDVKTVIALGDGAGANILTRFSILHPNRVMGLILCHCTSTTAGVLEYITNKRMGRKLSTSGMNQTIYDYLADHKFGTTDKKSEAVVRYVDNLKTNMNPQNLAKFFDVFLKRSDLSSELASKLKVETLLVTGSKTTHLHTVQTMHSAMSKSGSSILIVDNVANVIVESHAQTARALILFCKGCGVLSGVNIPGMGKSKTLSASMEEADRPGLNRSLSKDK